MIDFSRIHGFDAGRRDAFEELVCQLARREPFPNDSIYKRVEGAGGDGGVEAYWTKSTGKKTGYQAKFFPRSGEVDWAQIDKSVTQAIATHPELECFVIALPCDLTDKTGRRGRGKTGWQHWDERVKKWTTQAKAAGVTGLKFKAWTKSELLARLTSEGAEGLRDYFFSDILLNLAWFEEKLNEAILALDERFHPEDHVDVQIEKLFSVISRDQAFRDELSALFSDIKTFPLPDKRLTTLSKSPGVAVTRPLKSAFAALLQLEGQIDLDAQHEWDVSTWQCRGEKLIATNKKLQDWYWKHDAALKERDPERYDLRQCIGESDEVYKAARSLSRVAHSKYMCSEQERVALIRGNAGSGKSHLLARCAQQAIAQGQPAVILLGQRFNNSDAWVQISHALDLPGWSAERVLGALDAAGKAAGVRTLVLIDAINEGAGSRFWRNQLASLVQKIQRFPHVCCVISCRTEYFDLAVPEKISKRYPTFDIRGFVTPEEQSNAARVYLDRRGIARPTTPWLSPEFVNPLFLRSVCLSLEREKKSEIPVGMLGTKKVLT